MDVRNFLQEKPQKGQPIVAITDTGNRYLVVYADDRFWFEAGTPGMEIRGSVTHWMPLPDPPQEDGCTCQKCQRKYRVDLLVPDSLWNRINPVGAEGYRAYEMLCGPCIAALIEARSSFAAFALVDTNGQFDEADHQDPEVPDKESNHA